MSTGGPKKAAPNLKVCLVTCATPVRRTAWPADTGDITKFFPQIDRIFPGEALNPFFGAQDEEFSEFRSR